MSRKENLCIHLCAIYYGERTQINRGKPGTSKDYTYQCYVSADKQKEDYRKASSIEDLCNGCKKYFNLKGGLSK